MEEESNLFHSMAANSTTTSGGSSITDNGSVIDATHQHPNITSFISGVSLPEHLHDATKSLQLARHDGFDYVVTALPNTVPLLSSSSSSNSNSVAKRSSNVVVQQQQHHRTDVTRLESKWWSTSIVGMIVDPPHYNNTNNNATNMNMGNALLEALTSTSTSLEARGKKQEANKIFWGMMEWASHMNIPAVILPSVPLILATVDVEYKDDDDDVKAGGGVPDLDHPLKDQVKPTAVIALRRPRRDPDDRGQEGHDKRKADRKAKAIDHPRQHVARQPHTRRHPRTHCAHTASAHSGATWPAAP